MRKLIIAATTIAALAVPAISMAAYTGNKEVDTNYSASYVDSYGPTGTNLLTCNGVHETTTDKTGAVILVQDKMNCAVTSPTTGKRVRAFQPNQPLTLGNGFGGGWNSDFNGASATSMVGHANANGEAFTATATYPNS